MVMAQTASRRSLLVLLVFALSIAMIAAASVQAFPDVIPLPNGFQPEGIAVARGQTFYVGSIPTGASTVVIFGPVKASCLSPLNRVAP